MPNPCFECGEPSTHDHHVVPQSLGGTKTVPLCLSCHGKVHGRALAHPNLTRLGLASAKARGVKLESLRPGAHQLTYEHTLLGVERATERRRALSRDLYAAVTPIIWGLRSSGLTLREIGVWLDVAGHTTVHGKPWNPMQVSRLLVA
jgi:hypothetical protein